MSELTSVVHNCCNREFLASCEDLQFDWAVDDPPYFTGPEKRGFYGQRNSSIGVKRVDYRIEDQCWIPPNREYFDLLRSKSKNQIIWGINYFDHGILSPGRLIWDKVNDKTDYSDCEIALITTIQSVRQFRFMWNGMLQGSSLHNGHVMQGNKKKNQKRIHPTQKPVELYLWQYMKFVIPKSGKNCTIIDPHAGSGSSRIAADMLGLNYVGVEKSPDVYRDQEQRWREYQEAKASQRPQLKLTL